MDTAKSVYQKVLQSGVIRCGYFIEPPFTLHDENTGAFSGLSVDLIETIAKELGLKVEWAEQVSFATFPQDLKNRRFDMVCSSVFTLPRAGQMDYTTPYAYVPVNGYVKTDNTKFDMSFESVDWKSVKVAGLDGEGATVAAQKLLPEAHMDILPQNASISEMLLQVSTGKSDIGFVLPTVFEAFEKANPGILRKATLDKPLYTYAVSFGIAPEQPAFKALIDNVMRQLTVSGELENMFKKHDPKGDFKRPLAPMAGE
ncbi:MAG: transporter substrate-binding domain-containing protein [Alphaproteobacteria bacterium]|nr:transporter substrate-binding domain-containing protein [Alphaproteobacteria bacterium]